MHTETFTDSSYSPDNPTPRADWNSWIEIALLWLAVIVVIAFWK